MQPTDPGASAATCRCGRDDVLVRIPRGSAVCASCWAEMARGLVTPRRRRAEPVPTYRHLAGAGRRREAPDRVVV